MKSGLSEDARARAEAKFHLAERRKTEAEQALHDVRIAKDAEATKTLRLRELRLAKEEADRATLAIEEAAKLAAGPKRKTRAARA